MAIIGVLMIAPLIQASAQTTSLTALPTRMEPIHRSMEQLLNDGYEITAMNAGLAGFGFVLRRGHQWVLCTMGIAGEPPHGQPTSDCGKLN